MSQVFSNENRGVHRATPARVCCTLSVLVLQTLAAQPIMLAAFQTQQAQNGGSPTRVRVKLDGFDLSHAGKSPNQAGMGSHEQSEPAMAPAPPPSRAASKTPSQVGGAARSLGPPLYAPQGACAYTLMPTFYWRAEDPRDVYTFTLSSGLHILYSAKVTGGRFTYPSSAPALTPGESYTWSIASQENGVTKALITIVGGAERDALTRQIRSVGGPGSVGEAKILLNARVWFDALDGYTRLIERAPAPEFYRQRSALYDQLPDTYALADADLARAGK